MSAPERSLEEKTCECKKGICFYGLLQQGYHCKYRAALSPVQGELPELDIRDEDHAKYDAEWETRWDGLDTDSVAVELYCRERQLSASNAEVCRLREELAVYIEHDAGCARLLECGDRHVQIAAAICVALEDKLTSFAAGQQKGREECLDAVRGERIDNHSILISTEDDGRLPDAMGDRAYSVGIRDAERAILALPKVGQ